MPGDINTRNALPWRHQHTESSSPNALQIIGRGFRVPVKAIICKQSDAPTQHGIYRLHNRVVYRMQHRKRSNLL